MTSGIKQVKLEKNRGKSMLLYEQVSRQLREQIHSEIIRAGEKMPPISKLVKELKVDHQTVISAFDLLEKDGLIQRSPRKRAVVASNVLKKQSMLFIRWCGDPFMVSMVEGIQRFSRQMDQEAVLLDAGCRHEKLLNAITHPPEGVKGLILVPFKTPEYYRAIQQAMDQGMKIVFADRILNGIDVGTVTADHFGGGYMAVKHLIETHHQPVYHINFQDGPSSSQEWYRGWVMAMQENTFFDVSRYYFSIPVKEEESTTKPEASWVAPYEAAKTLFRTRPEQKYIIHAGNDHMAYGVYKAAEEAGLTVGRNVFIAGFGNFPFCEKLTIPLTSVYWSCEQLGYESAKLLYQELTGAITQPFHRILPVELKVRQSSTGIGG